jgi:hypothetical protein
MEGVQARRGKLAPYPPMTHEETPDEAFEHRPHLARIGPGGRRRPDGTSRFCPRPWPLEIMLKMFLLQFCLDANVHFYLKELEGRIGIKKIFKTKKKYFFS